MTAAPDETSRPDGRVATPEQATLRRATRALRLHLDGLSITYDSATTGDRFLAGLAFMSARQRYDLADSLIGAGFGGTVLGALSRSVFVDGLRWIWISADPDGRRAALVGDLHHERDRICRLIQDTECTCPNLARWLMPVPRPADLLDPPSAAGTSRTSSDDALLADFLARGATTSPPPDRADRLLDVAGLRGAVRVLADAGQGNFRGQLSSLTAGGAVGHDLRADHEALFLPLAAAGATATLLGAAATVPELWPAEVARSAYLDRAVELASEVARSARALHGRGPARPAAVSTAGTSEGPLATPLHPSAVLDPQSLLPDVVSTTATAAAAERFFEVAQSGLVSPWASGDAVLHAVLTYGSAHSQLQAVMSTYAQPASEMVAVFAARMLLEEAARLAWRYRVGDEDEFKVRAVQYFDEFRRKRIRTIALLTGSGVPRDAAEALFALPPSVKMPVVPPKVRKGRTPVPSVSALLRELGRGYAEPGWLELAYSLLSQATHATPLGILHTVRANGDEWQGNTISPELLALALDVACLSSAELLGTATLVLTGLDAESIAHRGRLQAAALDVHRVARLVHGLD